LGVILVFTGVRIVIRSSGILEISISIDIHNLS